MTRFRAETDQATRWLAFALTEVEKGFHRISGHQDMPQLVAALARTSDHESRDTPIAPEGPLPPPTAAAKDPPELNT